MRNASYPDIAPHKPRWSSTNNAASAHSQKRSLSPLQRWYRLSTPIEPPAHASFVWQENHRQARLFSNIALFLITTFVLAVPVCFLLPNPYLFLVDIAELIITCVCLYLNRMGLTSIAGIVQVASIEIAVTSVMLMTLPFDGGSSQVVDLFIVGELLTVFLLPTNYVFLVALYNSLFIWLTLGQQSYAPDMVLGMHSQFIALMARTVGLQFMVAGISAIWVHNGIKAIGHADKTAIERTLAEQRKELASGIEQIIQTHVSIANGDLNARVPLTQDHMLWQVARVLNSLLVRFQRASIAERELYRVERAITVSVGIIQQAAQQRQQARIPFTQTAIDPLIAAIQGRTFAFTKPLLRQNNHNSPAPNSVNTYTLNGQFSSRHIPP